MLEFNCKNCGQKISVPELHAGKKGKCPKCKTIVVVPEINNDIPLQPPKAEVRLKQDPPAQTTSDESPADGLNVTDESLLNSDAEEEPPERKLPWILAIFLYPTNMSGLINLGIFWLLPILLGFVQILPIPFIWIITFIAHIIVISYMYYFFMECIRDSAFGEIRAPENIGSMPDAGGALIQVMEIAASVFIFWGPFGVYWVYKAFWQLEGTISPYNPTTDTVFWLLLGYGVFFFPIGLLALAMFDSTSAFNPFLWIMSILSTFFQYVGLVLFFCVLVCLLLAVVYFFQKSLFFSYSFAAVFIYMAMVASHLLGRFYYLISEKLNWEV